MCRISTLRCPGQRVARGPAMASSRSARSGKCKTADAVTWEGNGKARRAAEAAARRSYGKLVAFLAHRMRDVAGAEDALSDPFATALAEWPAAGIPNNPEAWLITVARRKAINAERRKHRGRDAAPHLRLLADEL